MLGARGAALLGAEVALLAVLAGSLVPVVWLGGVGIAVISRHITELLLVDLKSASFDAILSGDLLSGSRCHGIGQIH